MKLGGGYFGKIIFSSKARIYGRRKFLRGRLFKRFNDNKEDLILIYLSERNARNIVKQLIKKFDLDYVKTVKLDDYRNVELEKKCNEFTILNKEHADLKKRYYNLLMKLVDLEHIFSKEKQFLDNEFFKEITDYQNSLK